jgi:hypothetical protein
VNLCSRPNCAPPTSCFWIRCNSLTARAVSLIAATGARGEYLPAYAPDVDPLEECSAKLKTILRTLKARTQRTLSTALKYALAQVTPEDIRGWFKHCGYTYSLN